MASHVQLKPAQTIGISRKISAFREADQLTDPRCIRLVNKLVQANLRLVVHIWRLQFIGVMPSHDDRLADLLQEGSIALCRAAQLYDPTRGYTFATYAPFWIRKGFYDYLRYQSRMVRLPAAAIRAASMANQLWEQAERQGRRMDEKDLEHIAAVCKTKPQTVTLYLERARCTMPVSLNQGGEEEGSELITCIQYVDDDPDRAYREKLARQDFDLLASRANLDPDERDLVLKRIDGVSYRDLKVPDLDRARRKHKAVMDRLRRASRDMETPASLSAA